MTTDPLDERLDRALTSLRDDRFPEPLDALDRRVARELATARGRTGSRWRLVGVIALTLTIGGAAAVASGLLDRWLSAFAVFRKDGAPRSHEIRGVEESPDGSTALRIRLDGDQQDTEVKIHPPAAEDGKRRIEVVLPPPQSGKK